MPIHYTTLEQLQAPYRQIVLSPHFDDAALSCGGTLARAVAQGWPVLVVSICTGSPDLGAPLSLFAEHHHQKWGLSAGEAMQQRLDEDIQSLETLGADSYQLDLLDAIYRLPDRYHDNATLFGSLAETDPLPAQISAALQPLVERYPEALFYAPLAIGNHVDHQATFLVAEQFAAQGVSVVFYEDIPYALQPNALEKRLAELGGVNSFRTSTLDIDAFLARKISAIEAYRSQIGVLFENTATMIREVSAYADDLRPDVGTYGERVWIRL